MAAGGRSVLERAVDRWVGRAATPDPVALQAVEGLRPAVVVTGASEGIGRALAERFAASGADLVLVARRAGPLDVVAEAIGTRHGRAPATLALDITAAEAGAAIDAAARQAGCYVDVLVNCAGTGLGGDFVAHDRADVDRLVALNVAAPTRLMHHVLPAMLARGRGGILNVASLGGWAPGPYQSAYYASKSYLIGLTLGLRHEVRGRGLRVAVLNPGPVDTTFHARMGAESALYRRLLPSMQPASVASAAVRGFKWNRGVIHPGIVAPAMAVLMRLMPIGAIVPVVGWLLRPRGQGDDAR
jgi:hypothetical protein